MQYFDDGRVGLSIEPLAWVMRLLPAPAAGGKPDFNASGVVMRVTQDICKLIGFSGSMSIRQQALIARSLRARGFRLLYVERAEGGTIPFGEVITDGDFAGHIRMDLEAVEVRIKKRYREDAGG
jgi:hypothetical protein